MRDLMKIVSEASNFSDVQPQHVITRKCREIARSFGLDVYASFDGERVTMDPDRERTTLKQFGDLLNLAQQTFYDVSVDWQAGHIYVPLKANRF